MRDRALVAAPGQPRRPTARPRAVAGFVTVALTLAIALGTAAVLAHGIETTARVAYDGEMTATLMGIDARARHICDQVMADEGDPNRCVPYWLDPADHLNAEEFPYRLWWAMWRAAGELVDEGRIGAGDIDMTYDGTVTYTSGETCRMLIPGQLAGEPGAETAAVPSSIVSCPTTPDNSAPIVYLDDEPEGYDLYRPGDGWWAWEGDWDTRWYCRPSRIVVEAIENRPGLTVTATITLDDDTVIWDRQPVGNNEGELHFDDGWYGIDLVNGPDDPHPELDTIAGRPGQVEIVATDAAGNFSTVTARFNDHGPRPGIDGCETIFP